jgi:hypothetical protein
MMNVFDVVVLVIIKSYDQISYAFVLSSEFSVTAMQRFALMRNDEWGNEKRKILYAILRMLSTNFKFKPAVVFEELKSH